jgi:hypothetical protein
VAHIPSIRRNIFALQVPKMTDTEVLQIISNGEREVGFTFEASARELIVAISRGSPYLANILCHHAAQSAFDESRNTVRASDVAAAISRTQEEFEARIGRSLQHHIRRVIEQGSSELLDHAAAVALSTDGTITARDLQGMEQLDLAKATRLLDRLAAEGLLVLIPDEDDEKRYAFAEDGLPSYVWLMSAQRNLRAARDAEPAPRQAASST